MKSDIEISRSITPRPITEIAAKLGLEPKDLQPYGHTIAKIEPSVLSRPKRNERSKLILVSAITPDPRGRGKDHHQHRARPGARPDRGERLPRAPGAFARPLHGGEGWRDRRRMEPGLPDGSDQPPFHGGLPRHHHRAQPALRGPRQPPVLRKLRSASTRGARSGSAPST